MHRPGLRQPCHGRRDPHATTGPARVYRPRHALLPTAHAPVAPAPTPGAVDPVPAAPPRHRSRREVAELLGFVGLVAYNWWVLVPLAPGLMRSPDELFSDLEVPGQPYASLMEHADLVAGLLIVAAFLVLGSRDVPGGRREWVAMVTFGVGGALGGTFSESCADGISAACRHLEWSLQLPVHHYLHIVAGIVEFAGPTAALVLARRRTRGAPTTEARIYRFLARGACVAYPLLGLAYLTNVWGGVMEGVFFVGFTVVVVTQLVVRAPAPGPMATGTPVRVEVPVS